MSRKGWSILAGFCGVLVVLLFVLIAVFRNVGSYRTLGGLVAIVNGDPPKHGFLGIVFGTSTVAPLSIQSVLQGSGAADAGLRPGDILLAAGTAEKPDRTALERVIQTTSPGEELLLKIGRGPDEIEVRVKLISFADMIVLREQERTGED